MFHVVKACSSAVKVGLFFLDFKFLESPQETAFIWEIKNTYSNFAVWIVIVDIVDRLNNKS